MLRKLRAEVDQVVRDRAEVVDQVLRVGWEQQQQLAEVQETLDQVREGATSGRPGGATPGGATPQHALGWEEQRREGPRQGDLGPREGDLDCIVVTLRLGEGVAAKFRIKKSRPLRELADAYCSRLGPRSSQVRPQLDGGGYHQWGVSTNTLGGGP